VNGEAPSAYAGPGDARTESTSVDDLQRILDEDAERTARRVLRRHKFGRLSDRRIITLLRPHADASGLSDVRDRQLLDLWFVAFARHVERLRGPNTSA
jgi:hypothetical protein